MAFSSIVLYIYIFFSESCQAKKLGFCASWLGLVFAGFHLGGYLLSSFSCKKEQSGIKTTRKRKWLTALRLPLGVLLAASLKENDCKMPKQKRRERNMNIRCDGFYSLLCFFLWWLHASHGYCDTSATPPSSPPPPPPLEAYSCYLGSTFCLCRICSPSSFPSLSPLLRRLSLFPCFWCTGLYSGSSDVNINGVLARVRGPFTPSQWLELEHQALIYKYIVAKVAIPPNLLTPIRRSLSSSGFHPLSAGPFGSNSLGWGPFYLGYSGNADPEPGRCRRTDGKKWRCSRDAVADQKYCERHMNRGRHRSRKHVEGQSGHAAKAMPVIAASQSATAVSGAGSSSSLGSAQPQTKTLQPNVREVCTAPFNMMVMNKENANDQRQDPVSLSMLTSMNPKPTSSLFSIPEHHNAFETTSSRADLQLVATDSHLNPATRSFSDKSCIASPKLQVPRPQSHPLHHFIDDWSKTQSDRSTITWPEIEEMQFERTQLSMSIPVASSEFSSSSSPHHENLTLSPLKLSREYNLPHMDSRINVLSEVNQRQISWIPISWETSMAGPLGEALANTSSMPKDQSKNCSSSSSLNLLTDGWDSSPRMESSPTGVLQKTSFGSLTSSTGSNPRAENRKAHESTASLSDDLLGPTLVGPPTIPSL